MFCWTVKSDSPDQEHSFKITPPEKFNVSLCAKISEDVDHVTDESTFR